MVNFAQVLVLLSCLAGSSMAAPAATGTAYSDAEVARLMTPDERRIADIREQEIEQLRLTLSRRVPVERRADLYLRLAEIHIEQYRAEFILEGRAHEARLERKLTDKFINRSRSKPHLRAAIEACKEILEFGVRIERLDQVYYFLAYNYSELGDERSARSYYQRLISEFPRSPFTVEAYKEMGEGAFLARDYRSAQGYLERAIQSSGQAPGFEAQLPRIRHRLAWSLYRQKQYARAVAEMKEAIRTAGGGGEKLLSIREEALKDLAIFLTESGNVAEAIEYFEKTAGSSSFYPRVLEGLGRQYERNVQPDKATQVYESLLRTRPDEEVSFRFRVKLVELDLRRAQYDRALSRFVKQKIHASAEGETATSWTNLRAMVRKTATENHERFRKSADRRALEVAEKFYSAYLDPLLSLSDPRNEIPEIRMYLADVKRELGKSGEASEIYKQVIAGGDSRYSKEAARLWTASLADAIKKDSGRQRTEASPMEREFVRAADDLGDLIAGSPEALEAEIRAAQVLAGYPASRGEAVERLRKLMDRNPRTKQAVTAGRLWVQIYSDRFAEAEKKDRYGEETFESLEALMEQIEEVRGYKDVLAHDARTEGKLGALLVEQESRFKILQIAFLEKRGEFAKAARAYERFAESSAKSGSKDDKAYENAFATYLKLGDFENSDRVLQAWQNMFPASEGARQALRNSATLQFVQGEFEASARSLERIARMAKEPEAFEAAIRILNSLGDSSSTAERRIAMVSEYRRLFPKSGAHSRLQLELARFHELRGDDVKAADAYRLCDELECAFRLGLLLQRTDSRSDGVARFRNVASSRARGPAAFFVGAARWELARMAALQVERGQQAAEKLTLANLARLLPARLKDFELLQRAMTPVLEIGGPYSVAASERLGRAAMELASEMDGVAPGDKTVRQASGALRSKAAQILRQGLSKARENEWLSPDWVEASARLAALEGSVRAQGTLPRLRWIELKAGGQGGVDSVRKALASNAKDAASWNAYAHWLAHENRRPGLALVALERAQALEPRSGALANNRAVLLSMGAAMQGAPKGAAVIDDPWTAIAVAHELEQAQSLDGRTKAIRGNRGQLLNYFGIFAPARRLWQEASKGDAAHTEAADGLGIALQGAGQVEAARGQFLKARASGAAKERFAEAYHLASAAASRRPGECLELLSDMEDAADGLERRSAELLRAHCQTGKASGKGD